MGLDDIPLWALYLGILVIFFLSMELGLLLGKWNRTLDSVGEGLTAQTITVLAALMALNSFLLGFTFSKAEGHFDFRRKLVIDDVSAIGSTFFRTEQLPEPQRVNSRVLLGEYVDRRHLLRTKERPEIVSRSTEIQQLLWAEATVVTLTDRTPVMAGYLQSLDKVIDLHDRRSDIEEWVRIPVMVFGFLGLLTVTSMVMTGYLLALRKRRYGLPTGLMVIAYGTTYLLILDLDRPVQGLVKVSQEPMLEEMIHADLDEENPGWRSTIR